MKIKCLYSQEIFEIKEINSFGYAQKNTIENGIFVGLNFPLIDNKPINLEKPNYYLHNGKVIMFDGEWTRAIEELDYTREKI